MAGRPKAKAKAAKPVVEDTRVPTMADVAQRAGVSKMTVSRALRDGGVVSKETRERILAATEDLGYVLDQSAGSLSTKRTGFIAAIVPSINNSNFSDTARGIADTLAGTGLQLLLGYTDYSVQREEQLIEAMLRRRPEGVILTGGNHTPRTRKLLKAAGIPVIETWDVPLDSTVFPLLVFAVFLARPSPFYILDEVEAALDDANIDRFLQLVRRFSDRAQFVIVTHQKRTMDAADVLYGVSMGEGGVTKVISRRLSHADETETEAEAA